MKKQLYIGAAYYPEMWEPSEIDKDIERCKALGINTLRVGEFAWSKMEPREGVFDFDWLKSAVDKLYENGIYTVMCTPSATPPRYMLDKYEELRTVGTDGRRADVSSRCHTCKTSELMREKNRIIVTEMAKAFKDCPGIIGWQIDNEIFPYDEGCHCDKCASAFRDYLKDKYGTIEALNKAWGMGRWSLDYVDFAAVKPPYPYQWRHPSLFSEWWRFQCRQIAAYIEEQADILHSFGCKNVGTDMMANIDLSYAETHKCLDVAQFNHYNTAGALYETALWYDFLRCVKDRPFWVTETQVGWNGSNYGECGYRPQGNAYANTMLPFALGGEMNMYWLFRTHPSGHEIGHGALFSACGRKYKVSDEIARAAADVERCREVFSAGIKSEVAIHMSADAQLNIRSAPLVKGLDYVRTLRESFYRPFFACNVDVIDQTHGLDGYKVVLSPLLSNLTEEFKTRIKKWVEAGGTWIVGPMTDIMTDYTVKYTEAPFSFLEELAGVYTAYQKPIDNNVFRAEDNAGRAVGIGTCFDAFEPRGAKSLVKYTNEEFAGYSAVCENKVGKGKVVILGTVVDGDTLLRLSGVKPIAEASDNVRVVERTDGAVVAAELFDREGYIELESPRKDVITGKSVSGRVSIPPYGVLVLK